MSVAMHMTVAIAMAVADTKSVAVVMSVAMHMTVAIAMAVADTKSVAVSVAVAMYMAVPGSVPKSVAAVSVAMSVAKLIFF